MPPNSAAALSQLQSAESTAQDPNTILSNQNEQLGVNNAQDTVTGLRGTINNTTKLLQQVAPSVMGRTANSLVTNAQATKQIGNEQAPIQQNLTQEGTDYNQANEDLGTLRTQAQTAASGIYQGQQDKLSYAQNLYNSLYQQEQDAANAAEQKREFDTQQATDAAAAKASAGAGQFNLTGGATPTSAAASAPDIKTTATSAIQGLIKQNSAAAWINNLTGIIKSANYGNQTDQAKLELARQLQPGLFNSDGSVNITRINYLKSQGLMK